MALRAKVLQIKADKSEAKKLQVHKVVKERVSDLDPLLQDVYDNRRPKPKEYDDRKNLVRAFNEISKEIYGNSRKAPIVVEFGSFVMDLFSNSSDLDLSINFSINELSFSREKKIQTLRKFAKKLYALQSNGHVSGVLPITTAKVPIVKCVDRGTGVECDISVENRDGISKSWIIHSISSIDERFHKLSFLMKTWAKANNINSSKDKTLNSLSLILLVAFHLQTRNPPILPPFSSILENGSDPASVAKLMPKFANYGKKNEESLAELFVTLLIKLSAIEKLWAKGLCASTCDATWTSKTWDTKVASFSVEDFTDRSQNVSRAVGKSEVKQIYKCINTSIQYVFAFMDGQIEREKLQDLLFGQGGVPIRIPRKLHPITPNGNQTRIGKRKQAMPPNRIVIPVQGFTGTQPPLQSCSTKKLRTLETGVGMPCGSCIAKEVSVTAAADGWGTQLPSGTGWGKGQLPSPAGWSGTQTPNQTGWGKGQLPSPAGWSGTQTPNQTGWGKGQLPSPAGWSGTQTPNQTGWGKGQLPSPVGWSGTQTPNQTGWGKGQLPSPAGWSGTQTPNQTGWGKGQLPSPAGWSGTQTPNQTGWGKGQLPSPAGWSRTQTPNQTGWGQPSRLVGWGGTQPPSQESWERTPPLSQNSWGGTQPPSQGSWGGTKPQSQSGWGGTQPPRHGDWGGTYVPNGSGWEATQLPRGNGWGGASNPAGGRTC